MRITLWMGAALALLTMQAAADDAGTQAALEQEAAAIVKSFGGSLKPKLTEAIQSGGLVHAVTVCSVEAPAIAANLSATTGWSVKRVSLKPRNKTSAEPDAFERAVLEQFDQRQRQGEPAADLRYAAMVDGEFRYMQAQGVEGLCLNCHGDQIDPQLQQALSRYYPQDAATGYSLGQIRGAFSLTRTLAEQ
jgi:hypothetical protein